MRIFVVIMLIVVFIFTCLAEAKSSHLVTNDQDDRTHLDGSFVYGLGVNPVTILKDESLIYGTAKVYLWDTSDDKSDGVKMGGLGIAFSREATMVFSPASFYMGKYTLSLDFGRNLIGISFGSLLDF